MDEPNIVNQCSPHQPSEPLSISQFLETLFQDAPGKIALWARSSNQVVFYPNDDFEKIARQITHCAPTMDILCPIVTHDEDLAKRTNPKSNGTTESAIALVGFFFDGDFGTVGHARKDLPPDLLTLDGIIDTFSLPPTMRISTGGGVHYLWLFREPWVMETAEEKERAQDLFRRFQATIIKTAKDKGYGLDNTAVLTSHTRIPGTFSHKTGTPRPVTLLGFAPQNRYNPSDFEDYVVADAGGSRKVSHDPGDILNILMECDFLKFCHDRPAEVPEPLWHAMISNLAAIRPGGSDLCHEFSRGHPKYRRAETDQKILNTLNYPPITCQHIRDNGFPCSKACRWRSPAGVWSSRTWVRQDSHRSDPHGNTPGSSKPTNEAEASVACAITIPGAQEVLGALAPLYRIPESYTVSANGILQTKVTRKGEETTSWVSYSPILVHGIQQEIETGGISLSMSFLQNGAWVTVNCDRGAALNSRKIVDLASHGFPVSTTNATSIIQYIQASEAINQRSIPRAVVTAQMGWSKAMGKSFFVLPESTILPGGERADAGRSGGDVVAFQSKVPGGTEFTQGIHQGGTYDEWKKAIAPLGDYPMVQSLIYASLAAPLIEILDGPNFLVNIWNGTSSGKTTALRFAMTIWGKPVEIENSWDNTEVFVERYCAVCNGIPVFLDDTKRAKKPESVGKVIYAIANGRGRGRGSKVGVQPISRFRTIGLSTGEAPITSFTADGGARARCIDLAGLPFKSADADSALLVERLKIPLSQNYGHAGPRFVEWFQGNQARWEEFRNAYRDKVVEYSGTARSGPEARMSEYIAVLEITARLAEEALGLGWDAKPVLELLKTTCSAAALDTPVEVRALHQVASWTVTKERNFYDSRRGADFHQDWYGRWDRSNPKPDNTNASPYHGQIPFWEWIAYSPDVLRGQLREWGFDPDAVIKGWKDRGWLSIDSDESRLSKQIMINKIRTRAITVKRSAFISIGHFEYSEEEEEAIRVDAEAGNVFNLL